MSTGNAIEPPHEAGEALPDGHAPTGQAPVGAGRHAGLTPNHNRRPSGISGLSTASKIIVALVAMGVAIGAVVHLAILFLSIAPANSLSQRHAAAINHYVNPEFTQGWRVFAPNVPAANVHVQARAMVLKPDGRVTNTGWVDLTAKDYARMKHDPFPSHAQQNELRLAWYNFVSTLDKQGRPTGVVGKLSQEYVERLAVHRLAPRTAGGTVLLVRLRTATTPVGAPSWSDQRIDTKTGYQELPWWTVKAEDRK
ncbi:DUF5819 family protein [Streptomyces sp. NPDC058691]|uniref:DUF5819 family protein n=1 Tax=Streptomyces sp. NPDC058691 TaxID=3346601 RepID=UPI0036667EDF